MHLHAAAENAGEAQLQSDLHDATNRGGSAVATRDGATVKHKGAALDGEQLHRGLAAHREEVRKWMTAAEHVDSIEVSYPALIDDPLSVIPALVEFLGGERLPHPERIPLVVDAALYRQRQVPQAQN